MTKVLTHFYWYGFSSSMVFYASNHVGELNLFRVLLAGLFSWGNIIGTLSAKVAQ